MTSPGSAKITALAVPGCQHVLEDGKPCQDAAVAVRFDGGVAIAVADGHGSERYTHSHIGARHAADVAASVLATLMPQLPEHALSADPDGLLEAIGPSLRRRVVFEWLRAINAELAVRAVAAGEPCPELTGDWSDAVKPYGTTVLAAAFTEAFAVYLALGDGGVITVDEAGGSRLFESEKLGQETFSLCTRGAVDHIALALHTGPPALAVLCTDGIADQYAAEPSVQDIWGAELLSRIREHGWVETALGLPRNLGALARDGDDCALALAWFGA